MSESSHDRFPAALADPAAFPGIDADAVEVHETHISWVFLVGDFAFKVKKPIKTAFLDYSSLEKRKRYCEDELRLDRRYAADLYLDVVPICLDRGKPKVTGVGEAIEYAVKMRRFPDGSLLSERMEANRLTSDEVFELARCVADFHDQARRADGDGEHSALTSVSVVLESALDNLNHLKQSVTGPPAHTVRILGEWTREYFSHHERVFAQRATNGFIRECHGDLHLENVVHWNGRLIPFDGIEFNDAFRFIDVINDAAFAAMDFAARGRTDLGRSFINAYLEQTGDHASLAVLRWYLVYRSLIRAKVASIRFAQSGLQKDARDCGEHIDLAYQFSLPSESAVWITRGVSGSGKTTASESVVQQMGAIRLRSDIERKRHFGLDATDRPSETLRDEIYSAAATQATYTRLRRMARCILRSGYPVVIDATFLRRADREAFRSLAEREGARFGILDCDADPQTLRQRITNRLARNADASDADLSVLEQQLERIEPLGEDEQRHVVAISDVAKQITRATS